MEDIGSHPARFGLDNRLRRGDVAPYWNQGHNFAFDAHPNRYIVLGFLRVAGDAVGQAALSELNASRHLVDDGKATFFCVASDSSVATRSQLEQTFSSVQFLWDPENIMSRAYGSETDRLWFVLNPMLRVVEVIRLMPDGSDRRQLFNLLTALPPASQYLGFELPPPVLVLPDIFEPDLCSHLIAWFDRTGGRESGFMQEVDGQAVERFDHAWKHRRDLLITDPDLIRAIRTRIGRRVMHEIKKAYHFKATRIERELLACYDSESEGHFGPHRDDVVKATMHRQFAMSINLNDDFEGGGISFPEYSPRSFKAPTGAAVVFSGSLLHSVSKVTRGRRYAFLSFFFDEDAEKIRQANLNSSKSNSL